MRKAPHHILKEIRRSLLLNREKTPATEPPPLGHRLLRMLPVFLFASFALLVIKTAWLEEDIFITFRTIDNFVNGYGLRWNIAERVQTFTHPLWMFILSASYFMTREILYTTLVVSIGISLATVWLLAFKISVSRMNAALAILPLLFSQSFIHYSTSGLENPLTHLLLALFFWLYLVAPRHDKTPLHWLFLLAGLAVLNRMDTLLLFAPALAALVYQYGLRKTVPAATLGFLPFFLWECFSLLYYGSLVPNTAYAKLNTGVATPELLAQGGRYLLNSLRWDPITLFTVMLAATAMVVRKATGLLPMVAGAILYLAYVVHVGGDYMTGRFLSSSVLLGAIALARIPLGRHSLSIGTAALMVSMGLLSPLSPVRDGSTRTLDHGIGDYRMRHAPSTGLWNIRNEGGVLQHPRAQEAMRVREDGQTLYYRSTIGIFGFYADRNLHILDPYALADPLLARLQSDNSDIWRVGHFKRAIPRGYMATLLSDENQIQDPEIADYYTQIQKVVRDPILSRSRLQTIWRLNVGAAPGWSDRNGPAAPREVPLQILQTKSLRMYAGTHANPHLIGEEGPHNLFVHSIPGQGLSLVLQDTLTAGDRILLAVEEGTAFRVSLYHQNRPFVSTVIPPKSGSTFTTHEIDIPGDIPPAGPYDLFLQPIDGRASYIVSAELVLAD